MSIKPNNSFKTNLKMVLRNIFVGTQENIGIHI